MKHSALRTCGVMRFNVIGHLTSEIGLGIMAGDYLLALEALGHEVAGYDVDPGLGRKNRSHRFDRFLRDRAGMFRDGVDLAVFPLSDSEHWSTDYLFGPRRLAVPLWELPDLNPRWLRGLRRFDGVIAPSDFIGETLARAGLETWPGPHPHFLEEAPADRAGFGLPDDKIVFTFAFDPSSDLQRKNPEAVIQAFEMAAMPNSLLCIQINKSAEPFPRFDQRLRRLPRDRVHVINRHLSHREAVQLIASSDVYLSLHRAEGLGLGMLEAMLCGKPVIATAWSGNLSFMDAGSACLISADIVPLNGTIPAYTAREIGAPSSWAAPRVAEAAQAIRRLCEDGEYRAALSDAALVRAHEYQRQARRLDWIARIPAAEHALQQRRQAQPTALVFTPSWIDPDTGEDVVRPKVEAAIKAQRWIYFDWHVTTDNPFPIGDHRNVLHQYQQAREYFLHGQWDWFVTIEHDNVLPDDQALSRLLETDGDVVYAPYLLRHGRPTLNTWRYINDRNLGMSLSLYPRELRQARQAIVYRISGAGMGCTAFARRAIEAIPFENSDPRNACPDLGFAEKALRRGFKSFGRFDVPVGHYIADRLAWPFEEVSRMQDYIPRETLNAIAAGRRVRLIKGVPIRLNDDEAADLACLGVLEPAAAPSGEVPIVPPIAEVEATPMAKRPRRKAQP